MNKKLFLKLGLLLLFLSFVSCGHENNSLEEDNYSKASTSQSVRSTENSREESREITSPSVKNSLESKQEEEEVQKNIQQDIQGELFTVAGGNNVVPEVCEYYLSKINVTKRIEPSIITGSNSYYDVKTEGNVYIDLILCVNSLSNEDKTADELITTKIKINNNEYSCFSIVESSDESDLEKDASIKPLEIRKIHYVAEVPITDSNGELEVILNINGKNFSNKFNLEGMMP